ncbi:MAG: hypothetical protein GY737_27965 [Desulfobacteraceae bacterium]|nr:hypothetical protein [Desulfobacteraceae bacterium]
MIRFFSSIRLTFILLVMLVFLLWMGTVFSLFPDLKDGIQLMNDVLIYQWFFSAWHDGWILPVWFLAICVVAGLLFVNTLVCSVTKQLVTALKVATLRRWSFFMVHIFFLVVLFCHGISLVAGHKTSNIELFEGDVHQIGSLTVQVQGITFSDDSEFLKLGPRKSRELMTRDKFHRTANFAELRVTEGDKPAVSGRVMMLSPLKWGITRCTLTKFIYGRGSHEGEIGISLNVTRNAFTQLFFVIYALMIFSLVCFIVITWTPQGRKGVIQ